MAHQSEFTENYNQVVADYYDSAYREIGAARGDREFYADLAAERRGPALELGCGTGRVLLELQRRGIECTGLDSSRAMLAKLRERAGASAPELVLAQMQSFYLVPRKFQLIYSAFRAFQHLYTVEDQLACLKSVLAHLPPGGRFAFDVFNPQLGRVSRPDDPEREDLHFEHEDGSEVVRYITEKRDPVNQITELVMRFETRRAGELINDETERLRMRWFTRYELEHLMARAGFTQVVIYGNFDRSPVRKDSPELVVLGVAPAAHA